MDITRFFSSCTMFLMVVCTVIMGTLLFHNASSQTSTELSSDSSVFPSSVNHIEGIALTCSVNNHSADHHIVIVDAGSTGSRIHVFRFIQDSENALFLQEEIFKEVEPGLSSYAFTPTKAANSLRSLLKVALLSIPQELQQQTPMVTKATAGLRLLNSDTADKILDEVNSLMMTTGFLIPPGATEIIDGVTEGIFSWMTVNYLRGGFSENGTDLVVAMDLGGGSTQVSLVPKSQSTLSSLPSEDLRDIYLMKSVYKVYTRSYLGLGMMSARFRAMGGIEDSQARPVSEGSSMLQSGCLSAGYKGVWMHASTTYDIGGFDSTNSGFEHCYASAQLIVVKSNIHVIHEIKESIIYAFSYYFDTAVVAELIDKGGGSVRLDAFKYGAIKECSKQQKRRFLCMDLTYIYALLKDGYQLDDSTIIHLREKENGVELSWSLGMAYHILSSILKV